MNERQEIIYNVLLGILAVKNIEFYAKDSSIRYGINNYVARFSLAKDSYYVTDDALKLLMKINKMKDGKLRRGIKSTKNGFIYEHPIPVNLVTKFILEHKHDCNMIRKILVLSDAVTIITRDEDEKLKKWKSKMPDDWTVFKDSIFARYYSAEIISCDPDTKIEVYGSLTR